MLLTLGHAGYGQGLLDVLNEEIEDPTLPDGDV